MVVATIRIVVPAYLNGKGPSYDVIRETYIIKQLAKHMQDREDKLIKKRAKLELKKILDPAL